jgi:crotonobetainyl-CoA:carnitine CoA-transferase CaiB-like acyl-CoA transferase
VHQRPAPTLGQHNTEVLGHELGIGTDKLAELEREGVIGTRPAGL